MIRARAGVVSVALVALSLVAGCAHSPALVPQASVPLAPQPSLDTAERVTAPPPDLGPTTAAAAETRADALLARVELPPDAVRTSSRPPALADSPSRPVTPYLVTRTRWFTVPGTLHDGQAFFANRREAGEPISGTQGSGAQTVGYLYGALEVLVSLAPLPARRLAVRVDVQVLWRPARPSSERIADRVRSVEVSALSGREVLAQRVLVGEPAQHLADLVNALPRDTRGTHGCRADDGRSRRLVFRTTGQTWMVTGFFCGSAVLVLHGVLQPGLLVSEDLHVAVDTAIGIAPSG